MLSGTGGVPYYLDGHEREECHGGEGRTEGTRIGLSLLYNIVVQIILLASYKMK